MVLKQPTTINAELLQCECKRNWLAYKNNCYYFSQYAQNFKKAERLCLGRESNLTSIQDTDERDWLIKTLDKTKQVPWSIWMGLKYKSRAWKWTDGSRFNRSVAFWGEDQPSMYFSVTTNRCAAMESRDDGRWYNYNCIFTDLPYICKRYMEPQLFAAPYGFGVLDKTEKLALEIVTNMVISGKVVPKTALNITVTNGLSCSSRGVNCSRALEIQRYKGGRDLQLAKLVGDLEEGRVIIIKGRVHQNATRFNISFVSNGGNIPLHMSARFNFLTDVNVLVMNSYLSRKWGKQERKTGTSFPFGPGQFFEMIITCTAKFFNMTINGDVHLRYKYRAPVAKIERLGAKGNVTLIEIRQI
ncbi:uncharacterized protein LOC133169609 [Syngnathus typhle]|uniref:uncharacterized protein LOC133169609 n=1 Tax=Syngnathus typhle TaxID=161592 RepID=UPI002A69A6F4|nr:uncharacterized protein LOC133169609 [Syngnathus typhle]